jgi:hypothetical protein
MASKLKPCKDYLFQTICLLSFDCPAHSLHDLGDFNRVDEKLCNNSKMILSVLLNDLSNQGKIFRILLIENIL